jgi:large conductance mechanosensitive channel
MIQKLKPAWIDEFKKFALKGNVVDMAVGVIIGGAFGKIVTSLVNDLLMPIIGAIFGGIDFTSLKYVIRAADEAAGIEEAAIRYGSFIQAIVNFLLIAIVIFLLRRGRRRTYRSSRHRGRAGGNYRGGRRR